ncbi:MAG: FHA domain-containing protein [Deltaproteobacteria bacterium]|nr:FHA domain-containing protein [Deltaproteobacteria bacterium]
MPILWVRFKDQPLSQHLLEKDKTLTIGRRENNNIVIDNLAVSGSHAKIDGLDEGFLLTDLKSKNGTFVNGKTVPVHWLKNGDVVTIGKHTLLFSLAEGEHESSQPPGEDAMDKTMVLDTDAHRAMLDKTTQDLPDTEAPKETSGILSFLKGGEGEIVLKKKLIKIGKDPSNDIVISGLMMGKTAITISKRPNGFYLSFVEGMTKPKVNGRVIKSSVQLKEFDTIELGGARMEFIIKE